MIVFSCRARRIFSGVIGRVFTRTPTASKMALLMTAAVGSMFSSPRPFGAERSRRFVGIGEGMLQRRHVAHGGDAVVGKIWIERPAFIDLQTFGKRVADALRQPAFDLAFGADGIDHRAAVGGDDHLQYFNLAGLRIDMDLRRLNAVIVSARLVTEARAVREHRVGVETAGTDDRRAVMAE